MRENERALLPLDKVHHQQRDPRLLRKTVSSLSNRHVRLVERYASCIALSVVESVTYFDSKEGYDQLTHSANVVFICVYVRILACTDEDRTTLKEANTFSPNSVMLRTTSSSTPCSVQRTRICRHSRPFSCRLWCASKMKWIRFITTATCKTKTACWSGFVSARSLSSPKYALSVGVIVLVPWQGVQRHCSERKADLPAGGEFGNSLGSLSDGGNQAYSALSADKSCRGRKG